MRGAVALVSLLLALVACASAPAQSQPRTELSITYWERGVGKGEPVRWTLRCNPARGTLPRPAAACRRLADVGPGLLSPIPPKTICTQVYGGPQVARITGVVAGKRVWVTLTRQDGCRISRWNRLAPWLLPPGGVIG